MEIEPNQSENLQKQLQQLREAIQRSRQSPDLIKPFIEFVFQNQRQLSEIEDKCAKMPKAVCARSIEQGELTYKCYDCGHNNQFHIYCERCFLDGEHTGHRYLRSLERYGCCDCGDQSALEVSGFCKHHGGFKSLVNVDLAVSQDIRDRLDAGLELLFGQLFRDCEKRVFDGQDPGNDMQINTLLETLAAFVQEFCKERIPILFEVGRVISKERVFTLRHKCGMKTYAQTFGDDPKTTHLCKNSIVDLLLMNSVTLKGQKENLSRILYSLFINADFKEFLVDRYVHKYQWMMARSKSGDQMREGELHNLFTQFFSKPLVERFINNSAFIPNVFSRIGQFTQLLKNVASYQSGHTGLCGCYHLLIYMQDRIKEYGFEKNAVEIMHHLMRHSFDSTPVPSESIIHQKHRLHADYLFINLFTAYVKTLKLKDPQSQKYLEGLVETYIKQVNQTNINAYEKCPNQWYGQPERYLGIVLLTYVLKFGRLAAAKMFNTLISSDTLEKICQKLFTLNNFCELKLLSKYVGFLGEETEKDVVKYFYRLPEQSLYDSDQLCLQMVAMLCNPELFTKYFLENVLPENITSLMLSLNTEQSYSINIGEACGLEEDSHLFTAKKNYIINAFVFNKKQTVQNIKQIFDRTIFNLRTVKLEQGLAELTDYNKESGLYSLKKTYEDLMERIYLVRNNPAYGKLFEKSRDIDAADFKKDNIIVKMAKESKQSICSLVTNNISKSIGFMSNFLCKNFRSLWDLTTENSKTNSNELKLISVFLTRNCHEPKFREFIETEYEFISDKTPKTPIQVILHELLTGFSTQNKLEDLTLTNQSSKATNRKKEIIEQMKRKRMKFEEKHKQDVLEEKRIEKDRPNSCCLICQQNTLEGMVIAMHIISVQATPKRISQSYGTCYHTFHYSCLLTKAYDLCPLCRLPYSCLLPQIYSKFTFHSKEHPIRLEMIKQPQTLMQIRKFIASLVVLDRASKSQEVSLQQTILQLEAINPSIDIIQLPQLQNQSKSSQESTLKVNYQTTDCLIVSKLQMSILDSAETYFTKTLPSLKSLLCIGISLAKKNISHKQIVSDIESLSDQGLINMIASEKISAFVTLLTGMIIGCYELDSTELLKYYERTISRFFNGFLAANLMSLEGKANLTPDRIPDLFFQQKEALYAQMADFCRGVLYAYSVGFSDSRQEAVDAIDRDISGVMKTIEYTPEFFSPDIKLITEFISHYPEGTGILFSQQSLLVQINLIPLPETYMEFHKLYYNITCDKCENYPRNPKSKAFMCLQCGYRGCNYDCDGSNSTPVYSLHNLNSHCSQGVLVDMDSNSILICENVVAMTYGHLYENVFSESDPEKQKDWSKLVLDRAAVSRIRTHMQKHTILNEIISKDQNPRFTHLMMI